MVTELDKIYNEDCLVTLNNMPDNYIDLIITSPPNCPQPDISEKCYQYRQLFVLFALYNKTKEGGILIYNHKNRVVNNRLITPYEWLGQTKWTPRSEIIWNMGSERFYCLYKDAELEAYKYIDKLNIVKEKPERLDKNFKSIIPVNIIQKFIKLIPNASIVYDPYVGSGQTIIATLREKRNFIGSEANLDTYKFANERIEREKFDLKAQLNLFEK